MVEVINTSSCCGSSAKIINLAKGLNKGQVPTFEAAGYHVNEAFLKVGLLYGSKGNFTFNTSFGSTKISVKCMGKDCQKYIDELVVLLTQLES